MKSKLHFLFVTSNNARWIAFLLLVSTCLGFDLTAYAAPTIVSVVPAAGATGVATSSQAVFTFSEAMFTQATTVVFTNLTTKAILVSTPAWNSGGTVLTCTPLSSSWPGGTTIGWGVIGFNPSYVPLTGTTTGSFSTAGSSGGNSGTGTNAITQISIGRGLTYDQYSTGLPTLDTNAAYSFIGNVTLASNLTATSMTLQLPTGSISNLVQNIARPEQWFLVFNSTNQTVFDSVFPSGTYLFNLQAGISNQQVTVVLPTTMSQPGAPHTTSFTGAQSVDSTLPFTMTWDSFPGGASTDYIAVAVGDWNIAALGSTNVLNGLATSLVIPANTLQPSSNYDAYITFYRYVATSNNVFGTPANIVAYKVTSTHFNLTTIGIVRPMITNVLKSAGSMSFDVGFASGQTVTIISSTNVAVPLAQWPVLLTTNAPGITFRFTDLRATTNKSLFYRARNGS